MTSGKTKKIHDPLITRLPEPVYRFFYSDWYLLVVVAMFFISWVMNIAVLGIIFAAILASVWLVVSDDALPLVPLLFCVAFSIADTSDLSVYFPFLPALAPLPVAIVFHCIRYRPGKFTFGSLGLPQIAVSVALLLGGCTSISLARYLGALPYTLLLGVGVFVVYFVFRNYVRSGKRDVGNYTAKALAWMGVLLGAEILVYYVRHRFGTPVSTWLAADWIDLGWGIDNNVATLVLLSAPACFYLSTVAKRSIPYLVLGVAQYVVILLTFSRGGILVAALTAPVTFAFSIVKAKDRKNVALFYCLLLVLLALALTFLFDRVQTMFANAFADGLSSESRLELYKEALRAFAEHPLFGVGGGYDGVNYVNHVEEVVFYWFHSTFFQIVGGYGVLGILAFGYLYYKKIRVAVKDCCVDSFALFLLLSFIGYESYSMIDAGTFIPLPNQMIVFVLLAVLEVRHEDNLASGLADPKKDRSLYPVFKHVADRVIAFFGTVLLSPLFALLALAVRLESKGPAVFRQERTGKDGKTFPMYKFRTMKRTDVPFDVNDPLQDAAPTVTKVGRFIRRFKLDELLQLLNVLRGEMSLVGPRPLLPVYTEQYEEWEKRKFAVRPGMTGLAQVKGNGHLSGRERSFYDVTYVEKISLFTDLTILVKTVGVVLFGEKKFLSPVSEDEMKKRSGY